MWSHFLIDCCSFPIICSAQNLLWHGSKDDVIWLFEMEGDRTSRIVYQKNTTITAYFSLKNPQLSPATQFRVYEGLKSSASSKRHDESDGCF